MGLCEVLMGRFVLSESVLPLVAERFKVLSEPARLSLLGALQQGEQTVNELVSGTGLGQANASKHLQVLHAHGFVKRRKDGLFVHYALADRQIMRLCELMSSRVNESTAGAGRGQRRMLIGRGGDSDEVG
jgi:DNA-binding transcriptional ArsR family regulator